MKRSGKYLILSIVGVLIVCAMKVYATQATLTVGNYSADSQKVMVTSSGTVIYSNPSLGAFQSASKSINSTGKQNYVASFTDLHNGKPNNCSQSFTNAGNFAVVEFTTSTFNGCVIYGQ